MKKKRILYLITRENVLDSGVLKSQVFELLGKVGANDSGKSITILNFPSVHKLIRSLGRYGETKKYAKSLGLKLVVIPILPIGRSIMPIWAIPFLLIQTIPFVLFFSWKEKINIFHARAYLSALIFLVVKKIGFNNRNFIFDLRGPYLLEGLAHGRWSNEDKNYNSWMGLERNLLSTASFVVAQSTGLVKYVKKNVPKSNVVMIPCCADYNKFQLSPKQIKQKRREMGLDNKFIVVYSGSLGSFHEPEFLVKSYLSIRDNLPNPHFLVVTHSDPKLIIDELEFTNISGKEYTIIRNPIEIGKVLPFGNIGLHVMNDLPITPMVIAVKFSEYLSAGLPVVISRNMSSLTEIVETSACGIVLDAKNQNNTAIKVKKLVKYYSQFKINAQNLAREEYSTEVVARKYAEIYETF